MTSQLSGGLHLSQPFLTTGFDGAPSEVRRAVAQGLKEADSPYIGRRPVGEDTRWWQLTDDPGAADTHAEAVLFPAADAPASADARAGGSRSIGLYVSANTDLEQAITHGLEQGFDVLLLDGSGAIDRLWPELRSSPNFSLLRDAITILRKLDREEEIDLVWFGGIRTGTDAAKILGIGVVAVVQGISVGIAAGGEIQNDELAFNSNYNDEDRHTGVVNLIRANSGEASMMARCTGKTVLHNIEPEDLRAITLVTSRETGIPMVGHQ